MDDTIWPIASKKRVFHILFKLKLPRPFNPKIKLQAKAVIRFPLPFLWSAKSWVVHIPLDGRTPITNCRKITFLLIKMKFFVHFAKITQSKIERWIPFLKGAILSKSTIHLEWNCNNKYWAVKLVAVSWGTRWRLKSLIICDISLNRNVKNGLNNRILNNSHFTWDLLYNSRYHPSFISVNGRFMNDWARNTEMFDELKGFRYCIQIFSPYSFHGTRRVHQQAGTTRWKHATIIETSLNLFDWLWISDLGSTRDISLKKDSVYSYFTSTKTYAKFNNRSRISQPHHKNVSYRPKSKLVMAIIIKDGFHRQKSWEIF